MKDFGKHAIIIAAMVIVAGSAHAQTTGQTNGAGQSNPWATNSSSLNVTNQTVSSVRTDIDTPDSVRSYDNLLSYTKCATNIGRSQAAKALAEKPESASERRYIAQMQDRFSSCKISGVVNTLSLQRGGLAEGLYHKLIKGAPTYGGLQKSDPGYERFAATQTDRNVIRYDQDKQMVAATDCLVAQQPALADAVLATRHGSPAERQAMAAIFAMAPSCAGPARPAVNSAFLRAFLADSAYQYALFRAPKQQMSANGAN